MSHTTIIANGIVLTCDAANRCGTYHLVVGNGRIVALSDNVERLRREHPDAHVLDATGRLVLPGFVNAHVHSEGVLLHPLTKGRHLALWGEAQQFHHVREHLVHPSSTKEIHTLYRTAYAAHLASGTTTVAEFPLPFPEESFTTMMDAVRGSGLVSLITLRSWEHVRRVQALGAKRPRVAVSLGDERELTVYSLENTLKAAKELKAPLLAHCTEQREDAETVVKHFHKGIIGLLRSFNALHDSTILVHANHISEDEVANVKEVGGTVVACPRSTAAKQTGYPALRHLAKRHVGLALGTDWGNVDMVEEMRFMNQLPMVVPGLRFFSALEIVRMATINGAHALGLQKETGSLEVGKRADMLFFSLQSLRLPRVQNISAAEELADLVVNSLTSGDLSDVMIGGTFAMKDRRLTLLPEEALVEEWQALRSRILPTAVSTPLFSASLKQPTNVLPFTHDQRATTDEPAEGFEAGFAPSSAADDRTEKPAHPFANLAKVQREPIKPELPKDTRRVFGEDDDF